MRKIWFVVPSLVAVVVGCSPQNGSSNDNGQGGASAGGAAHGGQGLGGGTNGGTATGNSGTTSTSNGGSTNGNGNGNGGSGNGNGGNTNANGGASSGGASSGGVSSGGSSSGGNTNASGGNTNANGGNTNANGGNTNANGGNTNGGGPASGGTTASGGTGAGGAGKGGAPASTACSFPSAWNPGSPTYTTYTLPNALTACGYQGMGNSSVKNIATPANFAAIPGMSSSNFNTSSRCGACVKINNAIITIVDECPYDGGQNKPCANNPSGHLDLSQPGASAAGVQGNPDLKNQAKWQFVPCPINGNVIVRLKQGNNNEFFVENEILPIQSVTCENQNGSRTSYGAWHFDANVNGKTCTLTDVANRSIDVMIGNTQNQDVNTGVQFPKCN